MWRERGRGGGWGGRGVGAEGVEGEGLGGRGGRENIYQSPGHIRLFTVNS